MTRASREKWLAEGLAVLAKSGVEAISVELLVARLGVAKASFHWHFGDRGAFLEAMLDHWREQALDGDGDRLFSADPRVDRAVRAWAVRDEAVRARVDAVDRRRLERLTTIHQRRGHPRPERAAALEYAAFVGTTWLFDDPDGDEARAVAAELEAVSAQSR